MLDLALLPEDYAVCRLPVDAGVPVELFAGPQPAVISITRTPDEISVICPAQRAPAHATVETPWRCFRMDGPLTLPLTGILASLTVPLAEARVNIFAFSTFDTDYVLVPAVRLGEARAALTGAGHRITG
ncbi:MAG TPA: ACT domain-containing protein [Pilimelia sp.]|nr:ACT domain-containing protein [Pilimelia sp.]